MSIQKGRKICSTEIRSHENTKKEKQKQGTHSPPILDIDRRGTESSLVALLNPCRNSTREKLQCRVADLPIQECLIPGAVVPGEVRRPRKRYKNPIHAKESRWQVLTQQFGTPLAHCQKTTASPAYPQCTCSWTFAKMLLQLRQPYWPRSPRYHTAPPNSLASASVDGDTTGPTEW